MKLKVKFTEQNEKFKTNFKGVYGISNGGYERGYAAGYNEGNAEGYNKGVKDGYDNGAEDLVFRTIKNFSSNKVTEVKTCMFQDCAELIELNIPNLKSVPNNMCQNCTKIKEVIFPKITGGVGISAFQNCPQLEYADVGDATSIGAAAFYADTSLHTLIIRGSAVAPMGNSNALYNTHIYHKRSYVYVPDNLVEQYKTATNWSVYASQIKPISELGE